jgi:hypothetical protein
MFVIRERLYAHPVISLCCICLLMAGLLKSSSFWFVARCELVCLCRSGTTFRPYIVGLFLDILRLKIETDMLSRNVGNKPTYAEQKPIKVKILTMWRRKSEISLRNSWRHVIQELIMHLNYSLLPMRNFLRAKWHLDRFSSDYFGSFLSITLHQFSKLMFHSSTFSGI